MPDNKTGFIPKAKPNCAADLKLNKPFNKVLNKIKSKAAVEMVVNLK